MGKITKIVLAGMGLVFFAGILTMWLLPGAVAALPGQVRGRLPQELLRAVTTPLPTALPPPELTPAEIEISLGDIGAVDLATPAPSESPTPGPKEIETAVPTPPSTTETEAPQTPTLAPTPAGIPLPTAVRLQGLQIEPQKMNNCGPANLSINLNFYGLESTQFDVADVVKPHYDDRNVSPEELVAYVNQRTSLRATLYRGGDLLLLKRLIAAGFPVVIEKGYEPDNWQGWMGHYLTLFGYDEMKSSFISMDTFLGPWDGSGRSYSYEEIQRYWEHFNFAFYVVYEPEQEIALQKVIGPTLIKTEDMWRSAVRKALDKAEAEPENAFAWFNLGSSLSQLAAATGESRFYGAAVTAFDQARLIGIPPRMLWYQFQLYEAYLEVGRFDDVLALTETILEDTGGQDVEETFLYRGHALLAKGDSAGATTAYRRAVELNPQHQAAREALGS
jgi:tetratricopeptide (TPR) repeat protein